MAAEMKVKQGKRAQDMTADELLALLPGAQEALVKAEAEVGIGDDELQRRAVEAVLSDDGGKRVAELQVKHGESVKKRDAARLTVQGLEREIAKAESRARRALIMAVRKQLAAIDKQAEEAERAAQKAIIELADRFTDIVRLGGEALRVAVTVPAKEGERRFRISGEIGPGFRPDLIQREIEIHLAAMTNWLPRDGMVLYPRPFKTSRAVWRETLLRDFDDFHERECPTLREGNTTGE